MSVGLEAARAAVARKASQTGVELGDLRIEWDTLDQTWGDRVGFVVWGGSPELRQRVAAFLERYAEAHRGKTSYECQASGGVREAGWHDSFCSGRGHVVHGGAPSYYSAEERAVWESHVHAAVEVPVFYYPCAD